MKKVALHVHTNLSDGALEPEEIISLYRDLEFGFVAITDHSWLAKPDYFDKIPDKMDGLVVLKGLELEVEELWYQHVLEIRGEEEILRVLCHPDSYHLTVADVNERIAKAPFKIDAVEVTALGFYTPRYDTVEIGLPKVATDDAHEERAVGRAWIEVDNMSDKDTLIRAIKAGDFKLGFR